MWRKGNPCRLLAGMETSGAIVQISIEVPQNTSSTLYRIQEFLLRMHIPGKWNPSVEKTSALPCFLQVKQLVKKRKVYMCSSIGKWMNERWYICTMGY